MAAGLMLAAYLLGSYRFDRCQGLPLMQLTFVISVILVLSECVQQVQQLAQNAEY